MATPSPTAWRDKPVTTDAGRLDDLEFAEDRLNAMRNVVRGMMAFEQNLAVPAGLRALVIRLTSMVRVDDEDAAGAVTGQDPDDALIDSRPDVKLPPTPVAGFVPKWFRDGNIHDEPNTMLLAGSPPDDDEDDTPLHEESAPPIDGLCCRAGCNEQAVVRSAGVVFCAAHWEDR